MPEPKTRAAKAMLAKLGLAHALIVLRRRRRGCGARRAQPGGAQGVARWRGLNVYDILNYDELLMTTKTARAIEARLGVDSNSNSNSDSAGDAR